MAPENITDWRGRLRGRLYTQFRNKPRLLALVDAFASQVQQLQNAAWAVLTERSIETAVGAQLDVIARVVGFPRSGQSDEEYRLYLRGEIRANRSSGTGDDVINVLKLVFPGASVVLVNDTDTSGGRFLVRLDGHAATDPEVQASLYFIAKSKLAGVKAWFQWSPSPDESSFTLGDEAAYPDGDAARGLGDSSDPSVGGDLAGSVIV